MAGCFAVMHLGKLVKMPFVNEIGQHGLNSACTYITYITYITYSTYCTLQDVTP